ncbi:MAG: hypothetical protein K2P79_08320 [Sphingomonas sp.]|nr:hypothetical protein [Sphingomonas sp.]
MVTTADMMEALEAIETVARQLAAISSRQDAKRKQDLIDARRALAIRTMTIMGLGEQYSPIVDNPTLYAELRRRLGVLRGHIADHQATWSAISIDSDDAAYRAASASVQNEGRHFMSWLRETVEAIAAREAMKPATR